MSFGPENIGLILIIFVVEETSNQKADKSPIPSIPKDVRLSFYDDGGISVIPVKRSKRAQFKPVGKIRNQVQGRIMRQFNRHR